MVVGDGAIVRAGLDALLDALHRIAAPTGTRGSILLMTGGLIVLGFLFLAFLFRSAIVGDLAPVSNARGPAPRVSLPPAASQRPRRSTASSSFDEGRHAARDVPPDLDDAMDALAERGANARILQSRADRKWVRVYDCAACHEGKTRTGCEHVRGLLAGAFQVLTGRLAKVHEVACCMRGDPHCEFEVRHAIFSGTP